MSENTVSREIVSKNTSAGALIINRNNIKNEIVLREYEIQKKEEENQKEINTKTDIGWGHQIRSYVLQPYQLVKDLRHKIENTNPPDVLNGNIDEFIEAGIINK